MKKNSIPRRIDADLNEEIEKIRKEHDYSFRRASKEIAKMVKNLKANSKIKKPKIKF